MTKRLYLVGAVILTAGILFGYDQGVISGALRGIEKDFDLGTTMVEIITSFVTLGALVGALVAGVLADRIGRKPTVLIAGAFLLQELPAFEIPRWPRPRRSASWSISPDGPDGPARR